MNKKLIFHPGAPHTGTSFIQCVLRDNERLLGKHGICVFTPKKLRDLGVMSLGKRVRLGKTDAEDTKILEHFGGSLCHTAIISHESLIDLNQPTAFVEWVKKFSGYGYEASIILSIRRQDTFLESSYRKKVKALVEYDDFQEFVKNSDLSKIRWSALVHKIQSIAGNTPLTILPYEYLKMDKPLFLRKIFEPCDFQDIHKLVSVNESRNKGIRDVKLLEILRSLARINQAFLQDDMHKEIKASLLSSRDLIVQQYLKRNTVNVEGSLMTQKMINTLVSNHSQDNQKLLTDFGICPRLIKYYSGDQ